MKQIMYSALFYFGIIILIISCNNKPKPIIVGNDSIIRNHKLGDSISKTAQSGKQTSKTSYKEGIDEIPDELLSFVPKNYTILDTISGDLNLDAFPDKILVLKRIGEDTIQVENEEHLERPLLLLIRDSKNKLHLAKRNDKTVYCIDCGGMMGDPFMGVVIKNGFFTIEHYGGSSWKWTLEVTYKYSEEKNDWFLHKIYHESFHAFEVYKTLKKTTETTKNFGTVPFEKFDIYRKK